MNTNLSINLFIVIGLIIIGLVIVLYPKFKKEKIKPNYRLFFILGVTWIPLGVAFYKTTRNIGFLVMGLLFLIIGLINKDKWGETDPVTIRQRKIIIGALVIGFLVLGTLLFKYLK